MDLQTALTLLFVAFIGATFAILLSAPERDDLPEEYPDDDGVFWVEYDDRVAEWFGQYDEPDYDHPWPWTRADVENYYDLAERNGAGE